MIGAAGMPQYGIEQMVAIVEGTAEFVRDMIDRRRAEPADDIVSMLVHTNEDGDTLSDDEIVAMVFLLVVADSETTYSLIANGVAALLTHPGQLDLLKTDPNLIGSAVEEILRFTGTIGSTEVFYAQEEVELHGVTIPRGARVIPLLDSANRDPAVFDDPDTFDMVPLLIQQLMGPMVMHMLFRPALSTVAVVEMPDLDTVCTELAGNFVRAMAVD